MINTQKLELQSWLVTGTRFSWGISLCWLTASLLASCQRTNARMKNKLAGSLPGYAGHPSWKSISLWTILTTQ
jgi:hypothetical protein